MNAHEAALVGLEKGEIVKQKLQPTAGRSTYRLANLQVRPRVVLAFGEPGNGAESTDADARAAREVAAGLAPGPGHVDGAASDPHLKSSAESSGLYPSFPIVSSKSNTRVLLSLKA